MIPVIDLFAGPGGLNEGFSRLGEDTGEQVFETIGSFEMEKSAIETLTLRATYRHLLRNGGVPDTYYSFIRGTLGWNDFISDPRVSAAHEAAESHIHQVELGSAEDTSSKTISDALRKAGAANPHAPWVLIGGPPCQAYSLAGRSRRANDETFALDKKHFLYREYLRIIKEFAPPVFVMENVKGLLSSTSDGTGMFQRIKDDLENPGRGYEYSIFSFVKTGSPDTLDPRDFIIRSESYGVPQKRHRVILLGLRKDFFPADVTVLPLNTTAQVSVGQALSGMPRLRSGISPRRSDSLQAWQAIRDKVSAENKAEVRLAAPSSKGSPSIKRKSVPPGEFGKWLIDTKLDHVIQHVTRDHMEADLRRYWFAANWARRKKHSPLLRDFPEPLLPNHKNVKTDPSKFADRFRVQVKGDPSTTIVSHIAKDGHYYIHPDPSQMRSLTVREAARLQTFPDNYFFVGNRTQQYHQVGNAVPPLLAWQIAKIVAALFKP